MSNDFARKCRARIARNGVYLRGRFSVNLEIDHVARTIRGVITEFGLGAEVDSGSYRLETDSGLEAVISVDEGRKFSGTLNPRTAGTIALPRNLGDALDVYAEACQKLAHAPLADDADWREQFLIAKRTRDAMDLMLR